MKKISVALFSFIMCFMVSSVTFAGPDIVDIYTPQSHFAIGGVPVGASTSYVKKYTESLLILLMTHITMVRLKYIIMGTVFSLSLMIGAHLKSNRQPITD